MKRTECDKRDIPPKIEVRGEEDEDMIVDMSVGVLLHTLLIVCFSLSQTGRNAKLVVLV